MGGRIDIVGHHLVAGVDASCKEDARVAPIEDGGAEEVLRRAVAIAITPSSVKAVLARLETLERVFHYLVCVAGLSVEVEQELLAFMHEEVGPGVWACRAVVGVHVANLYRLAGCRMHHGAVRGAEHGLSLAVAIPVVSHDVVLVVLEVGHVGAEVNPPQFLSVELVYLDDGILALVACGQVSLGRVAAVVELEKYLQLAVTVNVGAAGIVGDVGAL